MLVPSARAFPRHSRGLSGTPHHAARRIMFFGLEEPPKEKQDEAGYFTWFTGEGKSKEQLILEAKAERYVTQILALDRVLQNWRQKTLDKREAVIHADHVMDNIMAIGVVDGDCARQLLIDRGIDDSQRMALQETYQELKKACGHKVPKYGDAYQQASFFCC
ncbi:unnamed protein product [Effrenium voratum]|uniref:Uncharacterized protein n=1 Tax=Effrenium voratum TaxID=2562239 RepID=A0AA36J5H3_9DINO|nr:unnamed protein product [Effrenium voratum]CAJ1399977.1 unnamed protein product [Effrenium voratum]